MWFLELTKLGLQPHNTLGEHILYILPEILVLCCIMMNEIVLKLSGLYYNVEQDIESIQLGL